MKQTFRTLSGNVTFNTDGLLNESGMPSYAGGSLTSDDTDLISKETGSFSSNNRDSGQKQASYEKPVMKIPANQSQQNRTTGDLHTSGEMWNTDKSSVSNEQSTKEVLEMMKNEFGVDAYNNQNIINQIPFSCEYVRNRMVKYDKYICQMEVAKNLSSNENFYNELDSTIIDQPNKNSQKEKPYHQDVDEYSNDEPSDDPNDVSNWWSDEMNEPVGARTKKEDEKEEDLNEIARRIGVFYEMSQAGVPIIGNELTKELKNEYNQLKAFKRIDELFPSVDKVPVIEEKRFTKKQIRETILRLVENKEKRFYEKNVLNKPITVSLLKENRKKWVLQAHKLLQQEMWAVPNNDSTEVRHGWPLRKSKSKENSSEKKEQDVVEIQDQPDDSHIQSGDFSNGFVPEEKENTSDLLDPTKQHSEIYKAVNVEGKKEDKKSPEKRTPDKNDEKETELKYLNNPILGTDGKPLTWVDDRDIEEDVQFDEKLIKRFRKNANIGENTDWENYKKSIANAQSHEERQAIMKAYIAKSGPMGSSHTDIYKKQKDEPEKFKSKFHGMTPDAVAKYRAEHPKEEPPTESPEKVDESSDTDIIKYINKMADSGEAEKLVKGTNVESEPSQPDIVPPKLDFKDSRKKSKFRGIIKPDKIDEEESIKQRSDYWKRNKRIDSRNGYGNLGRDEIGQDSHVMDKLSEVKNAIKGMSKEKALEVLGSLKFKNEVRTAVLELKRKRLAKEGFEGAPGGFGQQNVQGSFAQTPNYSSQLPDKFGTIQSPNVESGSIDNGSHDRQENTPIDEPEENTHSVYEKINNVTNTEHHGGRIILGKVLTSKPIRVK